MLNEKRKTRLKRLLKIILAAACLYLICDAGITLCTPRIYGTIVNERGVPLDDVKIGVHYYVPPPYPVWFNYFSKEFPDTPSWNQSKSIYETMTVDGEFRVRDKVLFRRGKVDILSFSKEGYQREEIRRGSFQWGGMRVVMRKESPPPRKVRTLEHETGSLTLDMAEQKRCILELFGPNDVTFRPTVPFWQKPEGTRYFELDFLRDEWGEIVLKEFPGVVDDWGAPVLYPAVFIIRLHSDDPDDGILVVGEGESVLEKTLFDGTIRPYGNGREYKKENDLFLQESDSAPARFLKEQTVAPADGYTRREITIPIEEIIRIWDNNGLKACSYRAYRTVFVRVAGHYAKACFFYTNAKTNLPLKPVDSDAFGEESCWYVHFDMYLNPKAGSRQLSEYASRSPSHSQSED